MNVRIGYPPLDPTEPLEGPKGGRTKRRTHIGRFEVGSETALCGTFFVWDRQVEEDSVQGIDNICPKCVKRFCKMSESERVLRGTY